ncbi:MAG: NAD(P)H-hydrate dehydratase [Gammaproteobacteria bacterium]|nr:NAD(P)H-hydrate dehydratase [Gammaproteobacteria bacterium]MDH5800166.1 NAD(P)H-hydrate dehydratase [Gammaproteobacteria bacterium]
MNQKRNNIEAILYTAAQVRELDRITIEEQGIPGMTLMEHAGAAVFNALHRRWPRARNIAVLCGVGNNAGDGYVIARLADAAGLRTRVYQVGDRAKLKGDALTAFERLEGSHVEIRPFQNDSFEMYDVIVDALLGTGLQGAVSGDWLSAVENINQARGTDLSTPGQATAVVSVDIPTGLHADTGRVLGAAVEADLTVTFIGLKQGLLTGAGPDCCGEILFDDLRVPHEVYEQVPGSCRSFRVEDGAVLTPRKKTTYKNQCGHVLVVGGFRGLSGAARMAGEAALRCGAGLVSVAAHPDTAGTLNIARPELMSHAVASSTELLPLLRKVDVVAIGPGLGLDHWSVPLFDAVIQTNKPLLLDADALTLLAAKGHKNAQWVLTPHPGEASRLLNCPTHEVQDDRFYAIKEIQQRYGGVCVLKGCGTLISDGKETVLCPAGNPGMAAGGMGDVLSGVIAALMGQGLDPMTAALEGVAVHAAAADLASQAGERGLLATDLFVHLRNLVNRGE